VGGVKELRASNELLGNPPALREAIEVEGYVLLRDVLDVDLINHVKHGVMAWFEAQQVIKFVDDEPLYTGADASQLGENPPQLYDTKLWEWLALRPESRLFFQQVFGDRGRILPIGQYQFPWPGKPGVSSRIHQDGPFTPGLDFFTFWVPLMVIDEQVGGLAIVPTAYSRGSLHIGLHQNPTSVYLPPETFGAQDWHRADYCPGDVLIFGPFTPHCSIPNESDRLRLSVDIRVQSVSAKPPITGVVIAADPPCVVIAADTGEDIVLSVDDQTSLRLPTHFVGRLDPRRLVGHRVLATEEDGRALVIRNPFGHVPWEE
jgi:hypothetical protein